MQLPSLASTIQSTKDIILLLDSFEEIRDLTVEEWNFRNILNIHLQSLLHQQKIYWQQRGTIQRVKFGDECTHFFQANATIRNRKNCIMVLRNTNGQDLQDHEAKATLLWKPSRRGWVALNLLTCTLTLILYSHQIVT